MTAPKRTPAKPTPTKWTKEERALIRTAVVRLPIAMADPAFKVAHSVLQKLEEATP